MKLKVKKLHKDAIEPKYWSNGSSGFDLHSTEERLIQSGETVAIKTGLAFEVPEGYELQIRPRSGTSLNTKLRVANTPGTIDSDYRGEIMIILDSDMGRFPTPQMVVKGQRIAQAVLKKVERAEFELVEELTDTERGGKGLGSTGI